ncbi:MAG: SDR family NAD(P)-dependent oxidoreductase [Solirubrobacteraceae bacterium]|nr:SDR family NAD(P)-dependent oxidoreductase [Patulibacter sp.]
MDLDLTGRVAVITGASSGIGEATARTLAAHGAAVVLLARRGDRIQAIQQELALEGHSALAIETDVTDAASLQRAVVGARELGRVDLLVNNAGVMLLSPFDEARVAEWKRMVDTNVTGVFLTTNAFLDDLKDGGGDIVNISSVAGRTTAKNTSVYNATKWGVVGWSDALRQELIEHDVRVGLIEPGAVETELAGHIASEAAASVFHDRFDGMDILQSVDIADAILYMASRPKWAAVNEILVRPSKQP